MKKLLLSFILIFTVIIVANQIKNEVFSKKITFIGDSIMHSSKKYIAPNFDNSYFDTKIGRQFSTLPGIIKKLKDENQLGTMVVVHLGTNGMFKEKDFDDVMDMIGSRPVFFINTVHIDSWEKEVNKKLEEKVNQYKNAHLIDWYSHAKGKTEYFYKDKTHLKDNGQKYYSEFITKSIKNFLNSEGIIEETIKNIEDATQK